MFDKNIYVKFLLFLTIFLSITSCSSETSNNDQNAELEAKLRIANAELTAVAIVNEAKIKSNTENNQTGVPAPDVSKIEQLLPTPQINRIPKSAEINNNNKAAEKNILLPPTNIPQNIPNNNSSPIPTVTSNSAMSLNWNPTPTPKPSINRIPVIPTPTATRTPDKYGELSFLSPPMEQTRVQHTAVLMKDGRVMVIGGQTQDYNDTFNSVEIFDPKNGSWETKSPLNFPRYEASAVALKDNRVLVMNGIHCSGSNESTCKEARNSYDKNYKGEDTLLAELYDPISDKWDLIKMNHKHFFSGTGEMILLDDGQVLILGFNSVRYQNPDGTDYYVSTNIPEIFDPSLDEFYDIAPSKHEIGNGTDAYKMNDGRVVVFQRGYDPSKNIDQYFEIFDPKTGYWEEGTLSCYISGTQNLMKFSNGEFLIPNAREKKLDTSETDICYGPMILNLDTKTLTKLEDPRKYIDDVNGSLILENKPGQSHASTIMLKNDRVFYVFAIIRNTYNSDTHYVEYNPKDPGDNFFDMGMMKNESSNCERNPQTDQRLCKGRAKSIPIQLNDGRVLLAGGEDRSDRPKTIIYHPKVID